MRVLILGAGFGGLELATMLSESGEEFEVTLIDQSDAFVFGYSKLDVLFGRTTLDAVRLPYADVSKPGVQLLQETVLEIDPEALTVSTDQGGHEADVLVVALGADYDVPATPGLADVDEFYSVAGAETLAAKLPAFEGGRVVVGICGAPYKCPPAPSEASLLLHDYLGDRGVLGDSEITLVSPLPIPIPPSPDTSQALLSTFSERGIEWIGGTRIASIDGGNVVVLDDGRELPFDLFFGIPKHRAPDVVIASGMTEDGYIPVSSQTLQTSYPGVYAVGDVTTAGVPKAGVFAEGAARVVGKTLIAVARGGEHPPPYDGRGICYIEFGHGEVAGVDVDFLSGPEKIGVFKPPSPDLVREKKQFGATRRARWFGHAPVDALTP
jgi:sulfide:quinone oxidoreductase